MQLLTLLPAILLLQPALVVAGSLGNCELDFPLYQDTIIGATCDNGITSDGVPIVSYTSVDLDTCFGNVNGIMTSPGSGFFETCKNLDKYGYLIVADCRNAKKKKIHNEIYLDDFISVVGGQLVCPQ